MTPNDTKLTPDRTRSNLMIRIQTALILVPIGVGIIWAGTPIFEIGLFIIAALALREWIEVLFSSPLQGWWLAMGVCALCMLALSVPQFGGGSMDVAVPTLAACVMLLYLLPAPWGGLAAASGLLYIGFATLCAVALRSIPDWGNALTFFAIFVVIATDVGAYFCGRYFGGAKLAPKISPNKTWSGLLGGVVCAVGIGVAFAAALETNHLPQHLLDSSALYTAAAIIAACLAVISQLGDLAESYLKRQRHVKDSGGLLPGHGGVLDRIDGHLPVLIVTFLISEYVLYWIMV